MSKKKFYQKNSVKKIWESASCQFNIPIKIEGIDALPTFSFLTSEPLSYKTLFTELMLQQGFLSSTAFYATTAHTESIIAEYNQAVFKVFDFIGKRFASNESLSSYMTGSTCSPTFKRLN